MCIGGTAAKITTSGVLTNTPGAEKSRRLLADDLVDQSRAEVGSRSLSSGESGEEGGDDEGN